MKKDCIPQLDEVLEGYPVVVADWLKHYVWSKKQALDETEQARLEKKRLKQLKKAAKKIRKCDGKLPNLSHLLAGPALKQYEHRRKMYAQLYKDVHG